MNDDDELLDLVDSNDSIIGTIRRGEGIHLPADGGHYIRLASILIMNLEGELWLPVRSLSKTIVPGGYDNGAEGHVAHGESYEECAVRELKEETGISITADRLVPLEYTKFPGLPYFSTYFLLRTNQTPQLSSEHTSGAWASPDEAFLKVTGGHPVKETLSYGLALIRKRGIS